MGDFDVATIFHAFDIEVNPSFFDSLVASIAPHSARCVESNGGGDGVEHCYVWCCLSNREGYRVSDVLIGHVFRLAGFHRSKANYYGDFGCEGTRLFCPGVSADYPCRWKGRHYDAKFGWKVFSDESD